MESKNPLPIRHLRLTKDVVFAFNWKRQSLKNSVVVIRNALRNTMITIERFINIIYMFLKFRISKTRAFQTVSMMNPSKAGSALNTFLIRIKKFRANWAHGRHGRMEGRVGGSKKVK